MHNMLDREQVICILCVSVLLMSKYDMLNNLETLLKEEGMVLKKRKVRQAWPKQAMVIFKHDSLIKDPQKLGASPASTDYHLMAIVNNDRLQNSLLGLSVTGISEAACFTA
uniref:Uncharacterized protein n=1 Tax=Sphaerodactylus townsendi TaxID=933632 RepID=A0ACB8GC72_9SAUR